MICSASIWAAVVWGGPAWLPIAVAVLVVAALIVVAAAYLAAAGRGGPRLAAALLKAAAFAALALCLLEPLFSGSRPRPGANLFVILADNSRSMNISDTAQSDSRADVLRRQLAADSPWQARLGQDFDLRRYTFDQRLRPAADFATLDFQPDASRLIEALRSVAARHRHQPRAGLLLFTDGNATDLNLELAAAAAELPPLPFEDLPPIFPVVAPASAAANDLRIQRVAVSQTNFETTPVTVLVECGVRGFAGETLLLQLLDETGQEVQRQELKHDGSDKPLVHRFQFRPEAAGIGFYRVRVLAASAEPRLNAATELKLAGDADEATLLNNSRWTIVDRTSGPYRVLYVSGRPNWDFKFLRRAVEEDHEVRLVGLLRVAKKEPKFTFRSDRANSANPLFRGFATEQNEETEQYHQAVMVRLGTEDAAELREGFPKSAEELFRYDALILDDAEAEMFTADQLSLVQQFVSQRGGGFLMLGGPTSFAEGKFDHTPIGELLPVYPQLPREPPSDGELRLALTRDGWLQPWIRLRAVETDERQRLETLPGLRTLNRVSNIKPGASVLAQVERGGTTFPAIVEHRFGRGRAAAILLGDLWRWELQRSDIEQHDLGQAWRQTMRWLVADVLRRVEAEVRREMGGESAAIKLAVRVRDEQYRPSDDAQVTIRVRTPGGESLELTAEPDVQEAGLFSATFASREHGPFRATVEACDADGKPIGTRDAGWTNDPSADEFARLGVNRPLLAELAQRTGGELVPPDGLADFVRTLPNRKLPITEPWVYPLWHQWSVFFVAVCCLIGEWGIRRWNGLA